MPTVIHKATHLSELVIKIFIVLAAAGFLWFKVDVTVLREAIQSVGSFKYLYIAILLFLSIFNWLLEALKWQTLSSAVAVLSIKKSIQQSLTAHFIGFITPAKAGDYGTKALFHPAQDRKKILFLNFLGNMSQLLATLSFGILGLGYIAFTSDRFPFVLWVLLVLFILFLASQLTRVLSKIRWSIKGHSIKKIRVYVNSLSRKLKKNTLLYAFARYLVFSHQFFLLIVLFNIDIPYPMAMALISLTYLTSSLLPIMQLFDVVVRGGAAILVFGWVGFQDETIVLVTTCMWILNVVFPLIPGSLYVFTTDMPKKPMEVS